MQKVMKILTMTMSLALALSFGAAVCVSGQENATADSPTDKEEKAKEEREKKAVSLLDQILNEAQLLKLAENRIRVQMSVADLLWVQNEGQARSLFALAAEGLAEMIRSSDSLEQQRRGPNLSRTGTDLRRELVLTAARYDATLAYQLLAATRQLAPQVADARNGRRLDAEENLEQSLLSQVAALDPKLALQNAEQLLDKGEYPRALADVLTQLERKDKESASKLQEKVLKKLQSANMLVNSDAAAVALNLLQLGVRPNDDAKTVAVSNSQPPLLAQTAYQDLLGTVIDAALKATPQAANTQRRPGAGRGRGSNPAGGGAGQNSTQAGPTDQQIEQSNARRLLNSLRALQPQIDQYLPSRSTAVRQKMAELGMTDDRRALMGQFSTLMQQGNSESLISAASTAPAGIQSRIYQQAALKALDEGDAVRARQIANDHLEAGTRDSVLRTVEFRQLADKTEASRIEDVRETLAQLPSDAERINLLLRLSDTAREKNPELAVQLLEEAREFTNRRASSYQQFDSQLKVADALKGLGSAHSFEALEPGIMQLNELLSAAAVLSGFEVNVFRDGEMPLRGGNGLSDMVRRYGQQIGQLAMNDFERAQALTNRFQFAEPRIVARLAIARTLLGVEPAQTNDSGAGSRGFGQNPFTRRVN